MSSSVFNVNAQEDIKITLSSTDFVSLKTELQKSRDSINVLNRIITKKDSLIESKDNICDALASKSESLQSTIDRIKIDNAKKDSLIATLRENEKTNKDQMKVVQETLDRNIARLANGRLFYKYSENLVQESINSLQEIETEQVKKDFDQTLQLLLKYKTYSEDVKETLVSLQSIDRDVWKAKWRVDEYKNMCDSILKQSAYYNDVYTKKSNSKWSIPYLDVLLDAAQSMISRHNPGESEFANFILLIEML